MGQSEKLDAAFNVFSTTKWQPISFFLLLRRISTQNQMIGMCVYNVTLHDENLLFSLFVSFPSSIVLWSLAIVSQISVHKGALHDKNFFLSLFISFHVHLSSSLTGSMPKSGDQPSKHSVRKSSKLLKRWCRVLPPRRPWCLSGYIWKMIWKSC